MIIIPARIIRFAHEIALLSYKSAPAEGLGFQIPPGQSIKTFIIPVCLNHSLLHQKPLFLIGKEVFELNRFYELSISE